jgi:hypothetical protein
LHLFRSWSKFSGSTGREQQTALASKLFVAGLQIDIALYPTNTPDFLRSSWSLLVIAEQYSITLSYFAICTSSVLPLSSIYIYLVFNSFQQTVASPFDSSTNLVLVLVFLRANLGLPFSVFSYINHDSLLQRSVAIIWSPPYTFRHNTSNHQPAKLSSFWSCDHLIS